MDERGWLTSTRHSDLLRHGHPDDRRLRLIACAAARLVVHLCRDALYVQTVEVAERFADGLASPDELTRAHQRCFDQMRTVEMPTIMSNASPAARSAASATVIPNPYLAAQRAIIMSTTAVAPWRYREGAMVNSGDGEAKAAHHEQLAQIIREIIGNPFRLVQFRSAWRVWNNRQVGKIADAIYAEQRLQDLPVLADALEEAGCDAAEVLQHFRSGSHVRGCWALDLARTPADQDESG